ncbi:MAG: class I SAM-dependent methyltransferase [Acidimicrobiales bacterium]
MVDVSGRMRRVAVLGLDAVRDRAEKLRQQLSERGSEQPGEVQPPEDPAPLAEQPGRTYADLWSPPTVEEATAQIYNTTDIASFEEGGRFDFDWLTRDLRPEHTALDLGCGIGRVAYYVADYCKYLWAIDVSPRMLEMAQDRLSEFGNVTYSLCRDVVLPEVPTECIDLAYSLLVLQHVEREDAFLLLEELYRVVRPGGQVMLTFPNLLSALYLECFVDCAHRRASSQVNRARPYTPQEVSCVMKAAGFEEPSLEVETEIRVTAARS